MCAKEIFAHNLHTNIAIISKQILFYKITKSFKLLNIIYLKTNKNRRKLKKTAGLILIIRESLVQAQLGPLENQRVTMKIRSSFLFYARFELGFGDFLSFLEERCELTLTLTFLVKSVKSEGIRHYPKYSNNNYQTVSILTINH